MIVVSLVLNHAQEKGSVHAAHMESLKRMEAHFMFLDGSNLRIAFQTASPGRNNHPGFVRCVENLTLDHGDPDFALSQLRSSPMCLRIAW
jgi:hypothetical protein